MYKGITPTFTLTLPDTVDLTYATNVYVTFADKNGDALLTKMTAELSIDVNEIEVYLTQEETLKFPDSVSIQVNWTYNEGAVLKRACSEIVKTYFKHNLADEVLQ